MMYSGFYLCENVRITDGVIAFRNFIKVESEADMGRTVGIVKDRIRKYGFAFEGKNVLIGE